MTFPLSGVIVQVVISVCHAAHNHSPFPAWEGDKFLAWLNPGDLTLSEASGQSYETPLTWLGAIPTFQCRVFQMYFHCLCPSFYFFFIFFMPFTKYKNWHF